MPKIYNLEKNTILEINLIRNESLDIDNLRQEYMNWIPFNLKLKLDQEVITYSKDVSPSFSVDELKYLILNLNEIIKVKLSKNSIDNPFLYSSRENLFEMVVYETEEIDLIYLDIWFNMGSLTNGKIYGFSKGARFVVHVSSIIEFVQELESQFNEIILSN